MSTGAGDFNLLASDEERKLLDGLTISELKNHVGQEGNDFLRLISLSFPKTYFSFKNFEYLYS